MNGPLSASAAARDDQRASSVINSDASLRCALRKKPINRVLQNAVSPRLDLRGATFPAEVRRFTLRATDFLFLRLTHLCPA
jgi:hypothetical protein